LVQRVVTRGVVETRRLVLLAVLPGVLIGLALAVSGRHWLLWAGLSLLLTSATLLSVGKLVEHLLDIRYFRDLVTTVPPSLVAKGRARIRSLASREVEHVFCSTDLVQGQPLYVSSHEGGTIWRRTKATFTGGKLKVDGQRWEAKDLTIAE